MSKQEGQDWVKRVLKETPRLAQLMFQLKTAPASQYYTTGRYPDWIGDVAYDRFEWTKVSDSSYRADAVVDVSPGPSLPSDHANPSRVRVEVSVNFVVMVTPPPIIFFPEGKSLEPTRWTLHRVDGRSVEESGSFMDYRG